MTLTVRTTRTWAVLLSAALLLGLVLPVPAVAIDSLLPPPEPDPLAVCEQVPSTTFADQTAIANVHRDAVDCMAAYGIVLGVGGRDGLPVFDPGSAVTRQQFASFLARLIAQATSDTPDIATLQPPHEPEQPETPDTPDTPEVPETPDTPDTPEVPETPDTPDTPEVPGTADTPDTPTAQSFSDVTADNVHAPAIGLLVSLGITTGVGDGTRFAPGQAMPRQELATFLSRALDVLGLAASPAPETPHVLTDLGDAADVHRPAIDRALALGLLQGRSDATFAPGSAVTRQQLASVLAATAQLLDQSDLWHAEHPAPPPPTPERPETPGTLTVSVLPIDPQRPESPATVTVHTQVTGPQGEPVRGAQVQWALFAPDVDPGDSDDHVNYREALAADLRGSRTATDGRVEFRIPDLRGTATLLVWVSLDPTVDLTQAVLVQQSSIEVPDWAGPGTEQDGEADDQTA